MGGDIASGIAKKLVIAVSIHAPAWGATKTVEMGLALFCVSIHAPAWGATGVSETMTVTVPVSIHAPAWGATWWSWPYVRHCMVSIHAPAWGATSKPRLRKQGNVGFNPRPRMGGDPDFPLYPPKLFKFQSTPPHGGRLQDQSGRCRPGAVSIHAPAWGATNNLSEM